MSSAACSPDAANVLDLGEIPARLPHDVFSNHVMATTAPMASVSGALGFLRSHQTYANQGSAPVGGFPVSIAIGYGTPYGNPLPYLSSAQMLESPRTGYIAALQPVPQGVERTSDGSSAGSGSLACDKPCAFPAANASTLCPPGDEHTNALLQSLMCLPGPPTLRASESLPKPSAVGGAQATRVVAAANSATVDDILAQVQAQGVAPISDGGNDVRALSAPFLVQADNGIPASALARHPPVRGRQSSATTRYTRHAKNSTPPSATVQDPQNPPLRTPQSQASVEVPMPKDLHVGDLGLQQVSAGFIADVAMLDAGAAIDPAALAVGRQQPSNRRPVEGVGPASGSRTRRSVGMSLSMERDSSSQKVGEEGSDAQHVPALGPSRQNSGGIFLKDADAAAEASAQPQAAAAKGGHGNGQAGSEDSDQGGAEDGNGTHDRGAIRELDGRGATHLEDEDDEDGDGEDDTSDGETCYTQQRTPKKRTASQRRRAGRAVTSKKELCRERNRTAQRRFRERQKDLIRELQEKVDRQEATVKELTARLAMYENPQPEK